MQLRDLQRAAFKSNDTSRLEEVASVLEKVLESVMVAEEWLKEAASKLEDIKYLGTTLRTENAQFGSALSWNELMRKNRASKGSPSCCQSATSSTRLTRFGGCSIPASSYGSLKVLHGG